MPPRGRAVLSISFNPLFPTIFRSYAATTETTGHLRS